MHRKNENNLGGVKAFELRDTGFNLFGKLAKYWAMLKINYFTSTAYPGALIGGAITVVLRVWIFSCLYVAAYNMQGGGAVQGITVVQTVWMLMFVQCLDTVGKAGIWGKITEEVKNGDVAYSLGRPYSYIYFHFFGWLGRVFLGLILNFMVGGIMASLVIGVPSFSVFSLLVGFFMGLLGLYLNFMIMMIIGLTAFWFEETRPFTWIYTKLIMVFGGLIIPLQFFPENIQVVFSYLPFSNLYYFSSKLMVLFDWGVFYKTLTIQIVWSFIFTGLALYIFNMAKKHVTVNGG